MPTWSTSQYPGPGEFPTIGYPSAKGTAPPRAPVAPVSRLAPERDILIRDKFSRKVIQIIQARRPSTTRVYNITWSTFCRWCHIGHIESLSASIPQILSFLQEELDRGLSPNILHRQVTAVSMILKSRESHTLAHHPRVCSFLRRAANLRPPVGH